MRLAPCQLLMKINWAKQHICWIFTLHRASRCSTNGSIVFDEKERSILPMLWITMKFDASSLCLPLTRECHSFRTLTTLNFSIVGINIEVLNLFRRSRNIDYVRENLSDLLDWKIDSRMRSCMTNSTRLRMSYTNVESSLEESLTSEESSGFQCGESTRRSRRAISRTDTNENLPKWVLSSDSKRTTMIIIISPALHDIM